MAFPNIDVNKPLGTYRISTIDDYERETRRWLRDCMVEISGYPDSSALKVATWTTATRPQNPSQGVFGYNTDIGALEYFDGENWIPMTVVLPDIYDKARKDQLGNVIDTTYATKTELTNLSGSIPSVMVGATSNRAGQSGIVPQPAAGKQNSFLRGDGTWASPDQVSYSAGTAALINDGTDTENRIWSAKTLVDALGGEKQVSANGYVKLGSGLILQWGKTSARTNNTLNKTITYPCPFTTAVYSINCYCGSYTMYPSENGIATDIISLGSQEPLPLTSFQVRVQENYESPFDITIYWMAIGK